MYNTNLVMSAIAIVYVVGFFLVGFAYITVQNRNVVEVEPSKCFEVNK